MESKTNDATLYNVQVGELKVGVIDTPGFGDSRGFSQDKKNSQRIINTLKEEEYINCVCLIINGRQARASASLKYVLTEITAILPQDILDNVIVVFSNTSDPLDLTFDVDMLKDYFGRDVDNIFFVENPYCQFEKAKVKVGQLGIYRVAKSLQKGFEETSTVLNEMCEAIKNFPAVHTYRFVELYEKKKAIERNVLALLTAYDNEITLEKELKNVEEKLDEAVKTKTLNKGWRSEQCFTIWKVVTTSHHNTLCGHKGCYSNCHEECTLPNVVGKQMFRFCECMGGFTRNTCKVCGHDYTEHIHGKTLFEKSEEVKPLVNKEMEKKFSQATSNEERAQLIYKQLEKYMEDSRSKRTALTKELSRNIAEFEKLGAARSYAKVIENQLAVIETHLEGSIGPESDDLRTTMIEMEKKLTVI